MGAGWPAARDVACSKLSVGQKVAACNVVCKRGPSAIHVSQASHTSSLPLPQPPNLPLQQDTLEDRDAGTFQALLDFARQSHRPPGSDACPELSAGCQRIPTGLVLAGGVNSADHGRTFPSLADFLRQQGCYVVLLKPEHFSRGPGETIGEVLRQFSGLAESRAEHFAALAAWYADEAGSGDEVAQQAQQVQQQEQQAQQPAAGSKEGGKAEGRTLRQRPARSEQAVEAALAAEQAANRQRPLVVIVEGTEGVDVRCLQDFILVASEVGLGGIGFEAVFSRSCGSVGQRWLAWYGALWRASQQVAVAAAGLQAAWCRHAGAMPVVRASALTSKWLTCACFLALVCPAVACRGATHAGAGPDHHSRSPAEPAALRDHRPRHGAAQLQAGALR